MKESDWEVILFVIFKEENDFLLGSKAVFDLLMFSWTVTDVKV